MNLGDTVVGNDKGISTEVGKKGNVTKCSHDGLDIMVDFGYAEYWLQRCWVNHLNTEPTKAIEFPNEFMEDLHNLAKLHNVEVKEISGKFEGYYLEWDIDLA